MKQTSKVKMREYKYNLLFRFRYLKIFFIIRIFIYQGRTSACSIHLIKRSRIDRKIIWLLILL